MTGTLPSIECWELVTLILSTTPSWSIEVLDLSDVGFNEGILYNAGNMIPPMSATLKIDYEEEPIEGQDDGIYNLIGSDTIFLDVQELNTIFKSNGNFDIEVFKVWHRWAIYVLWFINSETERGSILVGQVDPYSFIQYINGKR